MFCGECGLAPSNRVPGETTELLPYPGSMYSGHHATSMLPAFWVIHQKQFCKEPPPRMVAISCPVFVSMNSGVNLLLHVQTMSTTLPGPDTAVTVRVIESSESIP